MTTDDETRLREWIAKSLLSLVLELEADQRITVRPYPVVGSRLVLGVDGRREDELRAALASATVGTIQIVAWGTPPPDGH